VELIISRLWLLSTLIGLYKLHMTKLPKFRATLRSLPDVGGSDDSVAKQRREASRGLREAIWANRKYLADLVFVCESQSCVFAATSSETSGPLEHRRNPVQVGSDGVDHDDASSDGGSPPALGWFDWDGP
jgi:hypothetical protein